MCIAAFAFVVFLKTLGFSLAACSGRTSPAALSNLLWGTNSGYDKSARPTLAAPAFASTSQVPPDDVFTYLQMFSVKDVDTVTQTFSIEVYVRTIWWDPRLRYADLNASACLPTQAEVGFSPTDLQNIWKPDLVFQNAAKPEVTFFDAWWLYPDGMVWWARKSLLTVACGMDFTHLPYDVQRCPVLLFGWQTTLDEVKIRFYDPAVKLSKVAAAAGNVEWKLQGVTTKEENDYDAWGCSCCCMGLSWEFSLARRPDYYVKYVMLPNYLFVLIAWSSFWVARSAAPARVALTIIIFLVITSQIASILAALPKLDGPVWLLDQLAMSQCFVLYGIIEYGFVNFLSRIEARMDKVRAACESEVFDDSPPDDDETKGQTRRSVSYNIQALVKKKGGLSVRLCVNRKGRMRLKAHQVDHFSRIAFPVVYAIAVAATMDN